VRVWYDDVLNNSEDIDVWQSKGEIKLQRFERMSSTEEFNKILQDHRKKHGGSISSSAKILSTLARILKTKKMMLYWDPDFGAIEGMRYLILGEENGCLFQVTEKGRQFITTPKIPAPVRIKRKEYLDCRACGMG